MELANSIPNQEPTLTKTDTQFYVLVVNLSTEDNLKLLEKSKSSFEKAINLNKYKRKVTAEQQKPIFDFLINPCFEGFNGLFVLWFEDTDGTRSYKRYYLSLKQIKNHNVVIDEQNFFD